MAQRWNSWPTSPPGAARSPFPARAASSNSTPEMRSLTSSAVSRPATARLRRRRLRRARQGGRQQWQGDGRNEGRQGSRAFLGCRGGLCVLRLQGRGQRRPRPRRLGRPSRRGRGRPRGSGETRSPGSPALRRAEVLCGQSARVAAARRRFAFLASLKRRNQAAMRCARHGANASAMLPRRAPGDRRFLHHDKARALQVID